MAILLIVNVMVIYAQYRFQNDPFSSEVNRYHSSAREWTIRHICILFLDVYMIKQMLMHEVVIALVIFTVQSFVFIQIDRSHLRKSPDPLFHTILPASHMYRSVWNLLPVPVHNPVSWSPVQTKYSLLFCSYHCSLLLQ